MNVVIIGSGNTASILGRKIKANGHAVVQVTGRNAEAVRQLASELDSEPNNDMTHIDRSADLYIAALADSALPGLHQHLSLDKKTIVHTAAAVSRDVLRQVSRNYGVLYPLQTLRKEQPYIPDIPFLVDGNTADDVALIQDFAATLSDKVMVADDHLRLKMHIAAVFVSNFVNYLYTVAADFATKEQIDFSMLLPLVQETANRLYTLSPRQSQTGPALRNDQPTIKKHLEALDSYPDLKQLYELFTNKLINKPK